MRIGELASRSGVATSAIRFYEKRGLLPAAPRRENGYREYPASTIAALQFIHDAQALGFSLPEIQAAVTSRIGDRLKNDFILRALERKLADVDAHIAASKDLRSRLRQLIAVQKRCR